jgi:xanthine dehydrogenase small subunit
MVRFILNETEVSSENPPGRSLLDYIRSMDLPGTKSGCREGDCGACTVLEGTLINGKVIYKTIASCITPLINVIGKHIVTIEGLNMKSLSPVQKAIVENSATQCGFCTPGFVVSLSAHSLSTLRSDKENVITSISGNICRCTGYKSIEKAGYQISELLSKKNIKDPVSWLVGEKYLPEYFLNIPQMLNALKPESRQNKKHVIHVGGGTDLMVQQPEDLIEINLNPLIEKSEIKGIWVKKNTCFIGAGSTMSDIEMSPVLLKMLPELSSWFKLISSEPVRNMATIGGNIVNASPIGDLTIIFLALNAKVIVDSKKGEQTIPLNELYLGYKKINFQKGDILKYLTFDLSADPLLFNFEKVSKRRHLDIASVNTAISIKLGKNIIKECFLSAGGVSPIPLFLEKTSGFIINKSVSAATLIEANEVLQKEIFPISDIRGSEDYKRLLLRQLFFAHFIKLFPDKVNLSEILKIK